MNTIIRAKIIGVGQARAELISCLLPEMTVACPTNSSPQSLEYSQLTQLSVFVSFFCLDLLLIAQFMPFSFFIQFLKRFGCIKRLLGACIYRKTCANNPSILYGNGHTLGSPSPLLLSIRRHPIQELLLDILILLFKLFILTLMDPVNQANNPSQLISSSERLHLVSIPSSLAFERRPPALSVKNREHPSQHNSSSWRPVSNTL